MSRVKANTTYSTEKDFLRLLVEYLVSFRHTFAGSTTSFAKMYKVIFIFSICIALSSVVDSGHFLNSDGTPQDMYHYFHLPHDPPLYPTYSKVPKTSFTCDGREWGYYADTEAECQVYHLCSDGRKMESFLCPNATLFHDQFKVCDQFYNVRCGWGLDDL